MVVSVLEEHETNDLAVCSGATRHSYPVLHLKLTNTDPHCSLDEQAVMQNHHKDHPLLT